MNEIVNAITMVLMGAAIIALAVTVLTEFVVKSLFELSEKALNIFVTVFSVALTVIVALAYYQITAMVIYWYTWVAIIFLGFLVASIAMHGYDKVFSYVFDWIKGIFSKGGNINGTDKN